MLSGNWYALTIQKEVVIVKALYTINDNEAFVSVKHPTNLLKMDECITVDLTAEYVHLGRFRALSHIKRDLPEYFV